MLALQESSGFEVMKEDELYYINGGSSSSSSGSGSSIGSQMISGIVDFIHDLINVEVIGTYVPVSTSPTSYQDQVEASNYAAKASGC